MFSQRLEQLHFSSQFVPIHSPLISSIVDFVCSSDQAAQELISSFTVWSPLRSELSVKFFLLWGEGCSFARSGVSLPESANRVCFCYCQFCQFCQYSFLLSVWVCIVCVLPRCVQPSILRTENKFAHFDFFFLSSSRIQSEGVSCCVWQECRSQLLLRRISPRVLCASFPGHGKEFR